MNSKKIERFFTQLFISIVIGGLLSALNYGIREKTGVLIEFGSAVSGTLSVIGAVLVGLLIKRYLDYQDKVKDVELNSKAPSTVVQSFELQKDEYFKAAYKHPINKVYLSVASLMVILNVVMPLDDIKSKASVLTFIFVDTGYTVATLSFLVFVGNEVIRRTEEARRAKQHFEKLKEMEVERQSLIETLNKKIREQRESDNKGGGSLRHNKEFNLRGYLDGLEKKDTEK